MKLLQISCYCSTAAGPNSNCKLLKSCKRWWKELWLCCVAGQMQNCSIIGVWYLSVSLDISKALFRDPHYCKPVEISTQHRWRQVSFHLPASISWHPPSLHPAWQQICHQTSASFVTKRQTLDKEMIQRRPSVILQTSCKDFLSKYSQNKLHTHHFPM